MGISFLVETHPENMCDMMPRNAYEKMKAVCHTYLHQDQRHFIFDPHATRVSKLGDPVIFPLEYADGFTKTVHAFLDDYGYIDDLEEEIGISLTTQFVLRLMFDDFKFKPEEQTGETMD